MQSLAVTLIAACLTGLATGLSVGPVLRALPEPAGAVGKPPYRGLATPGFAAAIGLTAAGCAAIAWWLLPAALAPQWTVLAGAGVLLAAIDLRTTWLPLPLTHLAWAAMAGAVLLSWLLAPDPWTVVRSTLGAALAGGLYAATWAASRGGFGFGDVRYAPLIGAATGAASWEAVFWALLLGSLLGAAVGIGRLVSGRRRPFPYAPAILAGAYLAVALGALTDSLPST